MSPEHQQLLERFINGEITKEEYHAGLDELQPTSSLEQKVEELLKDIAILKAK